jgi:WD40 repeat protein/serine/threonine protein kinase
MRPCPAREQFESLLAEQMGAAERDALEAHVEDCPACQATLEDLTRTHVLHPELAPPAVRLEPEFLLSLKRIPAAETSAAGTAPVSEDSARAGPPAPAREVRPAVPGYEILGVLGRGGMGIVYKARQVRLNRLVALKMILVGADAGPAALDRFRREAEAIASLQHPHIVQIYEVGEHAGRPYLALELVEGGSLAQYLNGKPLPSRPAAALVERLAHVVHYAHQRGLVHRDLKPANILLQIADCRLQIERQAGELSSQSAICNLQSAIPKITDFGLAKRLAAESEPGLTHSGQILGTPSYMAPEQAAPTRFPAETKKQTEVGVAADVYSLGAILYELLTGRPPFLGETALDTVLQVLHAEPVSLCRLQPKVPRDLETITLKCLHKDPARRYRTAQELAEDLNRFLAGEPIRARPVPLRERAWKWVRRHPTGAALVAGLLLCAGLSFGLVTQAWRRAEAEARVEHQAKEAEIQARRTAERQRINLLIDRYLALCEEGQVGHGLLGLAHTLTSAPVDAADLQHVLRVNLAAWRHRLIAPRQSFLQPHPITALAFSPDGRTLLTGSWDQTARLWDVATGQPVGPPLAHQGRVRLVAFRPDGQAVLTGSEDGTARLWTTATGQPLGPPLVHGGAVLVAAFSADGRSVATGSQDRTARVWDAATGQSKVPPLPHQRAVVALAFSPDGRLLLTGSHDRTAQLWEVAGGTAEVGGSPVCRFTFTHEAPVRSVAFSPDGRLAATASEDGTACLWGVASGKLRCQPLRHSCPVWAVAFCPDGKLLFTGSGWPGKRQGEVCLWDVATGQPRAAERQNSRVQQLVVGPGGRHLLSLSENMQATLWLAVGEKLSAMPVPHGDLVRAVAFGPDGRTFVTSGRHPYGPSVENKVIVWETAVDQTNGLSLSPSHPPVLAVACSPDGRTVLTGGGQANKGAAQVWDAATGQPRGAPLANDSPVLAVAFSPDGTRLLTGSQDHKARLWDAATGQMIGTPWPHPGPVWSVAFSPDGRTALTAGRFPAALLWDVATGQRLPASLRHDEFVRGVAFRPDGRTILTASLDATARLWDAATGQPRGAPLVHQRPVRDVAFSPDGRTAATGSLDMTAQLWDIATAQPLRSPLLHPDAVTHLAFSPDGRLLATTCGGDGSARFWDVATGKRVGPPLLEAARALAFHPDGRLLVTGSIDGTARSWEVPAPVAGDAARVLLWIQVLTGAELDAGGTFRMLEARTWQERHQRLQAAGGAPLP